MNEKTQAAFAPVQVAPHVSNGGRPSSVSTPLPTPRQAWRSKPYRICANCIMDTSDPEITFDARGWCDHCNNFYNNIAPHWQPNERGEAILRQIADRIKHDGRARDHDCLIGISGGVDSSYLTYYAKEKLGLRPLIFHVDAGWNSQQAVNNIEKLIEGLGLDLHTEVVDWSEMQDLQLAFLKAGLPYADHPQDIAFFSALYEFAAKHDFKYILTGANISTECVRQPLEWAYWGTDLRHIRDIHRRFGQRPLETFPMSSIFKYKLYYRFVKGIRVVKPLDLIPYVKETAVRELVDRFGWQTYAHKHYESRCTRFIESYWMPEKFGYDNRRAHFSSLILTMQMTRETALEKIAQKAYAADEIAHDLEYFATKIGISVDEFHGLVASENKSFRDYANQKWLIDLGNTVLSALGVQKIMIR
jgi:N-acetyl sugar amidotransferase